MPRDGARGLRRVLPLPSQLISTGRWAALATYAAAPWAVHHLRRIAGMETTGNRNDDDVERNVAVPARRLVRWVRSWLCSPRWSSGSPPSRCCRRSWACCWPVAMLLCGGSGRGAAMLVGASVAAAVAGLIANLPWSLTLGGSDGWTSIVGVPVTSTCSLGIGRLARFLADGGGLAVVAVLLFLPVVAATGRESVALHVGDPGGRTVAGFGALAVIDDRARCRCACPSRACCWCPWPSASCSPPPASRPRSKTTCSAARSAGASRSACWPAPASSWGWSRRLRRHRGRLDTPDRTRVGARPVAHRPTRGRLPCAVGWATRVIPVVPSTYQPGIGYAMTDDGPLTIENFWSGRPTAVPGEVATALRQMAAGVTLRGGRLLAQYGIRYVVVPVAHGANGTVSQPLPAPNGLVDVLEDQLDLAAPLTRPPNFLIYGQNTAYTPVRAVLTVDGRGGQPGGRW